MKFFVPVSFEEVSLEKISNRMFQLGKAIVSDDIIEQDFVCNLNACKGACCVDGEAGAPLEERETGVLIEIYRKVKPFLRKEGIEAIEEQGAFVKGEDGEWETPLVSGKECAYVTFSEAGIAQCGIEKAYNAGATKWKKPVSCHLYPVRVREYTNLVAVNYHKWEICDPACSLGKELRVPVYAFVKDALIRKFGSAWYAELEQVARGLGG
jgi:hypothetical protein